MIFWGLCDGAGYRLRRWVIRNLLIGVPVTTLWEQGGECGPAAECRNSCGNRERRGYDPGYTGGKETACTPFRDICRAGDAGWTRSGTRLGTIQASHPSLICTHCDFSYAVRFLSMEAPQKINEQEKAQ
ncbi:hypothetical protein ERICI_02046 [Paenibacillus larvae subsp. larvae]|nr:hypothetical protein ERICI_02046 [Paenibacillus larvae subsp. larvae]